MDVDDGRYAQGRSQDQGLMLVIGIRCIGTSEVNRDVGVGSMGGHGNDARGD